MNGWNSARRNTNWIWFILPGMWAFTVFAAPAAAQAKQSETPLAVLDGQPVLENQLPPEFQAQLLRMRQQVYGVELQALRMVIDRKVIDAEAKKKGIPAEELLDREVASKVADPTDSEVSAYYEARAATNRQSFAEVKDRIRQNLRTIAIQKARAAYIQGLVQQAAYDGTLAVMLSPPKVEIGVDPARLRGDPKAPITIVEFSDFSCSFCKGAESTVSDLLEKYKGKIRFSYRDYPLRQMHPQAQLAAEASRCAGEQGKYWEYHDLLFANSGKQDRDGLIADARAIDLDGNRFEGCLSSGRYQNQVDLDANMAIRSGVAATPGFFINGQLISGAQPIDAFERAIDAEISNLASKRSAQ